LLKVKSDYLFEDSWTEEWHGVALPCLHLMWMAVWNVGESWTIGEYI
jgi:hypothetical protein